MRQDRDLGRRQFLGIFGAALGAIATGCGPEIGTPAVTSPAREPEIPIPTSTPETLLKPLTEREKALKSAAEKRSINNPALFAWIQTLPDDVNVTVTIYSERQRSIVDVTGGLLTRKLPDRNSEVTYPTYLEGKLIETRFTITLSHPDGSRAQWDLVDEHLGGHFAAASITSSAAKGLVTEINITRPTLSGDILSFDWNKKNNTLGSTTQEPAVNIVLYDRKPPTP